MRIVDACKGRSSDARRSPTSRARRLCLCPGAGANDAQMTTPRNARETLVLGIETSCDETAAAVVARAGPGHGRILSNVVRAQWEQHRRYGGVVPEIAARAHVECLDEIIAQALREAGIGFDSLDGVAATAGPGLIGGLLVGVTTAKALALVHRLPLRRRQPSGGACADGRPHRGTRSRPICCCWSRAGHTQLLVVHDVGRYQRLGTTIDDALGEAFDKTAKLLGLGFPGGPAVETAARTGRAERFAPAAARCWAGRAAFLLRRPQDGGAPPGAGAGSAQGRRHRRPVRGVRGGRRRQRGRPGAASDGACRGGPGQREGTPPRGRRRCCRQHAAARRPRCGRVLGRATRCTCRRPHCAPTTRPWSPGPEPSA